MTPEQIKKAIRANGFTQKSLAENLGRSEMNISRVVRKTMISDYVMRGISKAIGKKYTKVFPEYYLSPAKRGTSKTVEPFTRSQAA